MPKCEIEIFSCQTCRHEHDDMACYDLRCPNLWRNEDRLRMEQEARDREARQKRTEERKKLKADRHAIWDAKAKAEFVARAEVAAKDQDEKDAAEKKRHK